MSQQIFQQVSMLREELQGGLHEIQEDMQLLTGQLSTLRERVSAMESWREAQLASHHHFWQQSWPEVKRPIESLDRRLRILERSIAKWCGAVLIAGPLISLFAPKILELVGG